MRAATVRERTYLCDMHSSVRSLTVAALIVFLCQMTFPRWMIKNYTTISLAQFGFVRQIRIICAKLSLIGFC